MGNLIYKIIKATGYEATKGALVIGTATIDLVNADLFTIIYLFIAAILFDVIKETIKQRKGD